MTHYTARELERYREEPKAMKVGTPGKAGYLNMEFELDTCGKSILRNLDRRVPVIVQQALYFDEQMPEMPCVYILSSGGQNVDGDRCSQFVTVRKGAFAFVSTGAATKLAEMRYNHSAMEQVFTLEENAYLEYLPEPMIPCRHTRFLSCTRLIVHPTATLFYSEIFMGGRKYYGDGELFKYDVLSVSTRGERPDGMSLFYEKMLIEPYRRNVRGVGVMHGFDVFANIVIMSPEEIAEKIYAEITPYIKLGETALGVTRLPGKSGLIVKILGMEASPVKEIAREICSIVRLVVKGKPLPEEFPWR
ncbi:MAG: urease accessory protein UreD [Muribaculaceae bacterium]|nr:urease accessory protein UreD [Muribaculaceae bacterium]